MTRGGGRRSSWWPTGHRGQTVPIGIWVSFAARRHRNPLFIKSSELCLSVDCVMRFFFQGMKANSMLCSTAGTY